MTSGAAKNAPRISTGTTERPFEGVIPNLERRFRDSENAWLRDELGLRASRTQRVKGPTWSRLGASGTTPLQDTSPNVGFSPPRPHAAAGIRIDPPVSVPRVAKAIPVATETAEPLLDPPGDRSGSSG